MTNLEHTPMTEEEVYSDLPDDPEQAFLQVEGLFRRQCDAKLAKSENYVETQTIYVEYISKVVAAIRELGLTTKFETEIPRIRDVDFNTYADFAKEVEHYRTTLQIRHARRNKGYSVRLDPATKQKIRHLLDQIRGIIDKLEVEASKKEELFKKLNAFASEVDKDRTRFEALGALVIQAAEVFGEAAEKAEPARKWPETIGRVIWGAVKAEEKAKQLTGPAEIKRIEPPKASEGGAIKNDDIPF